MQRRVLGPDFFNRPTLTVAKELLGKYLVRKVGGKTMAMMIVETEAYFGFNDQASKGRRGKTPGNLPMFAGPGTLYVYFTYGMHWLLNIVTEREEYPAAVLLRAASSAGIAQRAALRAARPSPTARRTTPAPPLLNGPAKLTKFLQIDKRLNGQKLGRAAGLWVEDRGVVVRPRDIKKTPRIGIPNAGAYVLKPWRFVLKSERAGT